MCLPFVPFLNFSLPRPLSRPSSCTFCLCSVRCDGRRTSVHRSSRPSRKQVAAPLLSACRDRRSNPRSKRPRALRLPSAVFRKRKRGGL
ncbi:hypothetical protein Taro_004641 [Colocasia esculenta]|uniref:Uncharacterized protein n=1 Tax=Colocasia esculenta TaxID=4460 RepID=A0A843TQ23_COLES|nr:hypothetical protein [Colocasia esculenta]